MPIPILRPSLTTNLESRYAHQHAGGAFEVKQILEPPGVSPPALSIIDAASMNGENFQFPNGFQVKMYPQSSQLLAIISENSLGISSYVENLDRRRYK